MPLTRIEPAAIADTRGVNFRNIIINGDMSVAQRATSSTGITSGGYETIDRIKTEIGTQGTWTQSQSTDVPSGQGFSNSFKMDCTTATASLLGGASLIFRHRFEGQNLQYLKKGTSNAESLTLSFWVKSNKTGTYTAELYDIDNDRQISKTYTIDSASTWEKKTITYDGDTTGTLDNDNGFSFELLLWLGSGSDKTSGTLNTSWNSVTAANRVSSSQVNLGDSTDNEWYITGVQLEAGTAASDFEFLPFDVSLRRCERYFYKTFDMDVTPQSGEGNYVYRFIRPYSGSTFTGVTEFFATHMRATPTVTLYTAAPSSGAVGNYSYYTGSWSNATPSLSISTNKFNMSDGIVSNITLIAYHFTADAEL